MKVISYTFDFIFLIDIFVNFNSAYYENDKLIDDRRKIVFNYLTGWFIIDLLAMLPIDLLFP